MEKYHAYSLNDIVRFVLQIEKKNTDNLLYFRGESKDRMETALSPSIFRGENLKKEEYFYREMQRFNEEEFKSDRTAFDKLSRMQHYITPTRMLDMSEDLFSALFFAFDSDNDKDKNSILYIIEVNKDKIKYYDSDAVSVVSNMAKIPLNSNDNSQKTKEQIHKDASKNIDIDEFNRCKSIKFLLHEIKEEKPQFESIIDQKHIFSIFCVKAKYSNRRILNQKGIFLLFGMNKDHYDKPIELLKMLNGRVELNSEINGFHPIEKITKIIIDNKIRKLDLEKLGISKPYIYPDLENVSSWLRKA